MDLTLLGSWEQLTITDRRDAIMELEYSMKALEGKQGIEIEPVEYHCNGVYAREIRIPFISPAGTKRAGYVIEDTVWTVFHGTTKTSEEEIRKEFIAPDYHSLDKQLEHTK